MTDADLIRGWCPSLFRPMESGDGWLARVRPVAGVISAGLALAVADAAIRFGNGIIEVTNRANIQIRGLKPTTIAPFTAAIEEAGGAAGEGFLGLISPLLGADPTMAPDTAAVMEAVKAALVALDRVGPRNKSADDDSARDDPAEDDSADAERKAPCAPPAVARGPDPRVYPFGRPDNLPAKFGIVIDGGGALQLTGISLDVTIRFVQGLWQVNGEACAPEDIPERVQALAGHTTRVTTRTGPAPKPGYHAQSFTLVMPAFGQMTAEAFAGLARLAQSQGDGNLRPTPWKSLCIAGVAPEDAPPLLRQAERLGFITGPDDGRLSITTCAGAPACIRGEVETHPAAAELARHRQAGDSRIHLSGCVKGCAHPGAAPITLVGRAGRFDLIRDGRTSDMPSIRHQTLAQIAALGQSLPS
ncbi:hypothetical protein ACELLULO517_06170 [Acidisoma cellulosilytica]|uniref:Nitrite/Sulfite reductase ferredoxin-like domain-containing protein n=1 Tax=Acidisoma cellulosilyticum TaxID=2802395 RepID=A0A964E3F7_9PROT|nr:hypothetical protein [Acidisoma cellulosilyticum]MCB8879813.1 hypothetical protein [Acidisoma cellulosilyticum]